MTLITVLIAFALEYFLGTFDRFRKFDWFDYYLNWIERSLGRYSQWEGVLGVLITLAVPVMILLAISYALSAIFIGLVFLLSIFVLIYCLGLDINNLLSNYIQSIKGKMDEDIAVVENQIKLDLDLNEYNETKAISSILLRSHNHIFGVLFWFIILGISGALLYCLTVRLMNRVDGGHGGYADAVRDLHNILMWPSARLLAIGFALSGSLVDTIDAWRSVDGHTLMCSNDIVIKTGLGALQYHEADSEDDNSHERYIGWIQETQAMINRSLIIWLTVLGILTIGGVLS